MPVPSPADGGYLLLPILMMGGLISLLRSRTRGVPVTLQADALTAALAIAAVSAAIVFDTAFAAAEGDPLGLATTLAYPLTDLVLGGFVVGALARTGWRLDRTWALLAAGLLMFWLADSLYLVETPAARTKRRAVRPRLVARADVGGPGRLAAAHGAEAAREGIRLIVMPLCFAAVGLGLLIYGASQLNALALVLPRRPSSPSSAA